jgi:hypothetical protein
MLENDMKRTIAKWRRDAEKRCMHSIETPKEAHKRAEHKIQRMVERAERPPKTDQDLKREYLKEIEKLRKRSSQNRRSIDADQIRRK